MTNEVTQVVSKVNEVQVINPADQRHFFSNKMKRLYYTLCEIEPEDVDDESLIRFTTAANEMTKVLRLIEVKRKQRQKRALKFAV